MEGIDPNPRVTVGEHAHEEGERGRVGQLVEHLTAL